MSNYFDAEGFYAALDAYRRSKDIPWKKVADNTNVSASTLTRMGQGKRPDVDSLAALASWSGIDASKFYRTNAKNKTESSTVAEITALLRADKNIESEDAQMMEKMLTSLYNDIRKRRGKT